MFSIRLGRRGRGASAPGSSLRTPASPGSPECGPSPPWAPSVAPAPAGSRGLSGCARSWQSRIKMAPHTISKTPFLMTDLSHALGHWKERRRSTTQCDEDEEHTETESADDSASIKSAHTSPKKPAFARDARDHHAQPLNAVFSFARAGLSTSKSLLERSLGKQHPRRASDVSESDYLPFTAGTLVSTKFGLGTIHRVRPEDGVSIIRLQGLANMTLFTCGDDEDYHSVPALVFDWVQTPVGEGCVVGYNARTQMYSIRIGGGEADYECEVRQADVQRHDNPPRRGSGNNSGVSTALHKSLSTALNALVSTSSGISHSTSQFVSNLYHHGQCVLTTFGPGCIVAMDAAQHRVQVQLTWGAMAYLQDTDVLYNLKALVGMDVHTKFGQGRVMDVRPQDAIYTVQLRTTKPSGEFDVVYVHESDVSRTRRMPSVQQVNKQVRGRILPFFSSAAKVVRNARSRAQSMSSPQYEKEYCDIHEDEVSSAGI